METQQILLNIPSSVNNTEVEFLFFNREYKPKT
jgi:hypothetical protein